MYDCVCVRMTVCGCASERACARVCTCEGMRASVCVQERVYCG